MSAVWPRPMRAGLAGSRMPVDFEGMTGKINSGRDTGLPTVAAVFCAAGGEASQASAQSPFGEIDLLPRDVVAYRGVLIALPVTVPGAIQCPGPL
jgi:hypothetical protein